MSEFGQIGKFLIIAGIILVITGLLLILAAKFNLFNLPGDISVEGKNWKFYFPIGTSILISIILTIILLIINLFNR